MATYTKISLDEMLEVLAPSKGWKNVTADLQGGKFAPKEHVFDWAVARFPGIVLRVYSSIHTDTAAAKGCGKDAIRVCAVDTVSKTGLVKVARVHRVEGWRDNLRTRTLAVLKLVYSRMEQKIKMGYWKSPNAPATTPSTAKAQGPATDAGPALPAFPAWTLKKDRMAWVREALATDKRFALWGLKTIYAYQTAEEQGAQVTVEDNGVGFSGVDAEIMSSFAEQLAKWESGKTTYETPLSPKQMELLHKKIKKYAKQIIGVLEDQGKATVKKTNAA